MSRTTTIRRAALAIALGASCANGPVPAQTSPVARPYQLTHSVNMDPSFSPDGKRIVYIGVVEGREQLFVANADGSASLQVTRDAADHEDPAWSPDGKRIAYVHLRDGSQVIHIMDPDGGNDAALTPPALHAIHPRWHPDGLRLAYCTTDDLDPPRKNAAEIQEIDLRSRNITTLVTGGINTYPSYSPDGRRLAFRKFVDGETNSEVFVANIDGSGQDNLSRHPAFDGWPIWSPDGRRIAFASNRNASYQIFVMDADGGNVQLVSNNDGRATAPVWSPDGRALYFPICRNADYGRGCEIYVAELEGHRR